MGTSYETDIVAWANEQASLLRAGKLSAIDIEHIAEEIEDVGKSEQRELASRMSVLLAHLLKWQYQPERRGSSWASTIKHQREAVWKRLKRTPSLRPMLNDTDWIEEIWTDALVIAETETGLSDFPANMPWAMDDVLMESWSPGC